MNQPTEAFRQVSEILEEIISIRRDLHAHPELSQQEARTEEKICQYLSAWNIPHQRGIAGHGVIGLIGSRGPCVAIRADMDALPIQEKTGLPYCSKTPGVMHACGHDIHMAALLGTAKLLKAIEPGLCGQVKLLFQPAEETVGGALPMMKAGCLKHPDVDAVIGLHVTPQLPSGSVEFCHGRMNAASNEFTITVTGASSHGARPHQGADALLAASQIVCALQSISSRSVAATDPVIVTAGQLHCGFAPNVIAEQAVLRGIIRTTNPSTRSLVVRRVDEIARLTAQAYNTVARVDFVESYPSLINDDFVEDILEETAKRHFSQNQIFFQKECSMGAEDFSYFCNAVRGAYFNIGTLKSPDTPFVPLHNGSFSPHEDCIRAGILMEYTGVLALLEKLSSSQTERLSSSQTPAENERPLLS